MISEEQIDDGKLYLYLLSQDQNNYYDTFDAMVVVAKNAEDARFIHPYNSESWGEESNYNVWCDSPYDVHVTLIGEYIGNSPSGTIILGSFNAG